MAVELPPSGAITLDENEILAQFDRLVKEGLIFYDQAPMIMPHRDGDLRIEFKISGALKNKPSIPSDPLGASSLDNSTSNLKPGSDINVAGFEIQEIGTTHLLTFNMFNAFRPHFLLLTQDGYRRQFEPLDIDDIKAAHTVISSLTGDYMVLYNCGVESGCSRMHKHMQLIPHSEHAFDVWRNIVGKGHQMPYQAFVRTFGPDLPSIKDLFIAYLELFDQVKKALGRSMSGINEAPPHNVIFDRSGMMVIPRRSAGLNGAYANAAGMLGVIWMSNEAKAQQWIELGPSEILRTAGVPMIQT
ncbi:hypothetical protein EDB81DRAFT_704565 [Dactylonectria macrodidyma]|uniref:ATP adenylyltransferase n=1 Tax=Dactylonectria macrodidyma TaxID=307937 RepID=A0A9P9CZ74_9HYPO|nr:hypothetical protein EDB81DRAFT_704565 [Dactylonectria macrodidyma]